MIEHISAENSPGKGGCSDGCLRTLVQVVLERFRFILGMDVRIMEPISLERNKIRTGRDTENDLAVPTIAQLTQINSASDSARFMPVRMLPLSAVSSLCPGS